MKSMTDLKRSMAPNVSASLKRSIKRAHRIALKREAKHNAQALSKFHAALLTIEVR